MKFKAIKSSYIYESVINQILDMLKIGEIKAGDKLPTERDLSKKLCISRSSLREALKILELKGIILNKQGKGRFVRGLRKGDIFDSENILLSLEKSSILDLLEAREVFEVKIVELAAQRATDEDINLIEKALINTKIDEDLNFGDYHLNDREFHIAIANASHNFVFLNILTLNIDLLRDFRKKAWGIPGRKKSYFEEHKEIFEAIKRHDSFSAAKLMKLHLSNIRKAVYKL